MPAVGTQLKKAADNVLALPKKTLKSVQGRLFPTPELPESLKPTKITPPSTPGPEEASVAADVRERQKRLRGRRAARIAATPGALAISDVNILRPELKDTLA